eukprot:264200-Chlamydomonas_euryale.AAC.1
MHCGDELSTPRNREGAAAIWEAPCLRRARMQAWARMRAGVVVDTMPAPGAGMQAWARMRAGVVADTMPAPGARMQAWARMRAG